MRLTRALLCAAVAITLLGIDLRDVRSQPVVDLRGGFPRRPPLNTIGRPGAPILVERAGMLATGVAQMMTGGALAAGGGALSVSVVGAPIGVPAAAAGTAIGVYGAVNAAVGAAQMLDALRQAGTVTAGGLQMSGREGEGSQAPQTAPDATGGVTFGENAIVKLRKHSQHIRETARRLGIEIPKSPALPETRAAMEAFITKVVNEGRTVTGQYMTVENALWSRLGDAIVIRRPDRSFLTFLDASKGGVAHGFPGGL